VPLKLHVRERGRMYERGGLCGCEGKWSKMKKEKGKRKKGSF